MIKDGNDSIKDANIIFNYHFIKGVSIILDGSVTVKISFGDYTVSAFSGNKELTLDSDKTAAISTSPKDYKNNITLNIDGYEYTFTVFKIINAYKANADKYDDKTNEMVNKLEAYCQAANDYFSGNNVADQGDLEPDHNYDVVISYEKIPDIDFVGCTLLLKSEAKIRFYFKNKSTSQALNYTADINGQPAVMNQTNNDIFYYETSSIKADSFGNGFTLCINDNNSGKKQTITGSVLSYCNQVLDESNDNDLKNLCKAIYKFFEAAQNYVQ